jgi:pimeloyl-ACP methyl ester carboxylesterase
MPVGVIPLDDGRNPSSWDWTSCGRSSVLAWMVSIAQPMVHPEKCRNLIRPVHVISHRRTSPVMIQQLTTVRNAAILAVATVLAPSTGTALRAQQHPPGHLERAPYVLKTFDGHEYQAELGHLAVRETRRGGRTNTIELAFIRLPSRAPKPGPPIVFLMGGPGIPASVMGRVPPYATLFDRLRDSADVILVDQRGVGLSSPVLACPSTDSLPASVFESRTSIVSEMRRRTAACAAQWEAQGAAVAAYNSAASADDLENLRQALGVERISVLAFSYGTHVALAAVRRHPESLSRVVLAGTRGPDQSLKLPSTFDFVFRRLATLATGEAVTGRQMPHLVEVVRGQLERLDRGPIKLTVTDRRQNRQVVLAIGKDAFLTVLTNAIDNSRLPAMLYAMSLGDDSLLTSVVEGLYNGLGDTNLMARAIDCASGASEERLARVRRETAWALLGNPIDNLVRSPDFCQLFESIDLGDDFRRPIWTDTRTLFVSGTLDAKAPVFEAEEIRVGFPNSAHLIVENAFHETVTIPEVQRVIADFLAGSETASQRLVVRPPQFLTIDQAKAPTAR